MIPLMQPQDVHMILEAAVKFIEKHEVMEIAVTSISGAFGIAFSGFKFGLIHKAKIDKSAMELSEAQNAALRAENDWLRARLEELTAVIRGIFSAPARNPERPSHIQEASSDNTLKEINAALPSRSGRWPWRRRRDNR